MTSTSASVQFSAGGVAEVGSSLRLTGGTCINCYTYDDRPPILGIDDAHVKVSITVPEPGRVTDQDVTWARLLAEAVGRYVAELEQLAATTHENTPGTEGCAGRAA